MCRLVARAHRRENPHLYVKEEVEVAAEEEAMDNTYDSTPYDLSRNNSFSIATSSITAGSEGVLDENDAS